MKYRSLAVLWVCALLGCSRQSPAVVPETSRQSALEQTRAIARTSLSNTGALRQLETIIEGAQGNIPSIMKCVFAVATHGSNTPVIVSLASAVSRHKENIEHFDELLVIAMLHQSESVRIESDLQRYVDGAMTIEELRESAQRSMQWPTY